MHRGWFALWRKVEDHPFYSEPREYSKFEAWLDILLQAQHEQEPQDVLIGMKLLKCHYGECLKSNGTWAGRWKWSEPKVRRFLKLLKNMNQIRFKSEGITTRISVLNYDIYDPKRRASDEQATRTRRGRDEQVTTDNNDKNDKNVKNSVSLKTNTRCPYQKIAALFNATLPSLPEPNIDENRKKQIQARWREHPDLEWWKWYFTGVSKCDFLMGRVKEFGATLHWLTGPKNMSKVLNGQYTNRKAPTKNQAAAMEFLEGSDGHQG